MDFLFGFDTFISYARKDASEYARGLADELAQRNFGVCLDVDEFAAGEDLNATTRRNLAKSTTMVLVVTPAALGVGTGAQSRRRDVCHELVCWSSRMGSFVGDALSPGRGSGIE